MLRKIHAIAAAALIASVAPAHAAVTTTGCASATTCTLSELYAGGTIKIGDVTFGGFAFNNNVGVTVNPAGVLITGVEGANTAALDFGFSPDLVASIPNKIGYTFNYNAAVDGASSRRLNSATLSTLTPDSLFIEGAGLAQVDMGFSSSSVVSIFKDFEIGSQLTDTLSLSNLTTLAVLGALTIDSFASESGGAIQSFRFSLGLSGDANVVPLPAAAPLFLAGLVAFGARRRKPLAKALASA